MTDAPASAGAPGPGVDLRQAAAEEYPELRASGERPGEPADPQAAAARHRAMADAALDAAFDAAEETDQQADALHEAAQAIRDKANADRDHMHAQADAIADGQLPPEFPQPQADQQQTTPAGEPAEHRGAQPPPPATPEAAAGQNEGTG